VAVVAIDIFIPEVWSARLQRHLDNTLVYAQPEICNREWEGEIKESGATVHINKIGDPEIKDYDPGVDMDPPEEPDGTSQALVVDQDKYFNVMVDDVNKAQANVKLLDRFGQRAGVQMANTIDAFVGGKIAAASTVNVTGTDASPIVVKADGSGDFTPYELAVEMRRQLKSQEVPINDIWMVIDADLEAELLEDPKYIEGSQIGAETVRSGQVGRLAGFQILVTQAVPASPGSGGGTHVPNVKVLAGAGNYATTFASQVTEMEAFRPERRFGDAVKGLEVYGAKVLEPETVTQAHVAK
jgi:N4-gp56 family major capsid protein